MKKMKQENPFKKGIAEVGKAMCGEGSAHHAGIQTTCINSETIVSTYITYAD
jgi:hypothetical protein